MAAVLLDTTVLIDALRGRQAASRLRALRRAGGVPFVCAVNVDEVWRCANADEAASVSRLLRGLRIAPLGRKQGELSGRWRREFAREGVTLHQADCLVAAAALGVEAHLATGNPRHFPMRGLTVEYWSVGE